MGQKTKRRLQLPFRTWLTIVTTLLLCVVIFAAWPEIVKAWGLLDRVNLWILALLIPVQLFSYYATGGMIFSYLRAKGNLKEMSHWRTTRLALELNFVNHVLPSGGAAGFSYLAWVLKHYKVSVARSTMAQVVRFTLTFISFAMLMVISIVVLTLNHGIERNVVLIAVALTALTVGGMSLVMWLLRSRRRLDRFERWLQRLSDRIVRFFTRGKRRQGIKKGVLAEFFDGIHDDYTALMRERKILIRPYIWAAVANIADVALLWIAFWSLGFNIDPALLFVAFGISSIAGAVVATPGGAGAYETVMVAFLATSGVSADVAIAGTLLARVTLVLGTIVFGYVFYQMTITRQGKAVAVSDERGA